MNERYVIRTGRTDIRPGDTVIHTDGHTYRALTYPYGAVIDIGGITVPRGMVADEAIYTPEIGELVAESYNPPLGLDALKAAMNGATPPHVKRSRFGGELDV